MIRKRFKKQIKESFKRSKRRMLKEAFDSDSSPKVYVGTYGLYNEGSLEGDWFELSDYDSKEDFYKALADRFKGIDDDPEYMFQDWENCGDLVSESHIDNKLFDLIKEYEDDDHGLDWEAYVQLASEYDLDNMFMAIDPDDYSMRSEDEAIGYAYVDMLGSMSELGQETLENYFDYESFGRDLKMDFSVEEIDGKLYLFN